MKNNNNIVIIGSGNLATNLAAAIYKSNYNLSQIHSRNVDKARILAEKFNCSYTVEPGKINSKAGIYFLAVSDNSVSDVLQKLNLDNNFIVHTSGSLGIDILKPYSVNYGVFYPVQTFSKVKLTGFTTVPVCIEANNRENENILAELAMEISGNIYKMDSEKRMQVHLAAIFASNFVNHLYSISEMILKNNDISFEILTPLINEVKEKAVELGPLECQTGPAIRNDKNIIEKHLNYLTRFRSFKNIYNFVTKSIYEMHSKNKDEDE